MTFGSIVNPKSSAATGIALMLLACFVYSLNDALGKWLVSIYSVGLLLTIRSVAAILILLPFLMGGKPCGNSARRLAPGCNSCGSRSRPARAAFSTGP